jgi:hypothetical protein
MAAILLEAVVAKSAMYFSFSVDSRMEGRIYPDKALLDNCTV